MERRDFLAHSAAWLGTSLLAQAIKHTEAQRLGGVRQFGCHGARLDVQVREQGIDRRPAQIEASLERLVDLDVEPRLDALGQELHRNGIDDGARHHSHRGKHDQHAKRQQ